MSVGFADARVLVLNKSFLPIHVTSLKRAFCMVYRDVAKFVDREYRTFDFESWAELSARQEEETIGLVNRKILLPKVILIQTYDRLPKRQIRFSRLNIFARDRCTCQYCGKQLPKSELNLDHVVPRSQGGETSWENIVCSCLKCNRVKGGRTPEQAKMKLVKQPHRPRWTQVLNLSPKHRNYRDWLPFLNVVDYSYWNVELEP